MLAILREIIARDGQLPVAVDRLSDNSDLFAAGLDSLGVTRILMAVEDRFDVVFTDAFLVRGSFATLNTLADVIAKLKLAETAG